MNLWDVLNSTLNPKKKEEDETKSIEIENIAPSRRSDWIIIILLRMADSLDSRIYGWKTYSLKSDKSRL